MPVPRKYLFIPLALLLIVGGMYLWRQSQNLCRPDPVFGSQVIAFTGAPQGNSDIYTIAADGCGLKQLTDHPAIDSDPQWSPDGTRIAFVSQRDGRDNLYVMQADGSHQRRLTADLPISLKDVRFLTYYGEPQWSPDGTSIAWVVSGTLYRIDSESGDARLLAHDARNPAWSVDGTHILYGSLRKGQDALFLVDISGATPPQAFDVAASDSIAWADQSPNGRYRTVTIDFLTKEIDPTGHTSDIALRERSRTELRILTDSFQDDYGPDWSPDSEQIVYVADDTDACGTEGYDNLCDTSLYRMNIATRERVQLTDLRGNESHPVWRPR
jgi:Tol biopolymer transport system component